MCVCVCARAPLFQQQHHRLHQLLEDAASEPRMMSCNASVRPQETDGAQPRHNGLGSAPLSLSIAGFQGSRRESCRGGLSRAAADGGGSRWTADASTEEAVRTNLEAALRHQHHLRLHPASLSPGAQASRSAAPVLRVDIGRRFPLCTCDESRAAASDDGSRRPLDHIRVSS